MSDTLTTTELPAPKPVRVMMKCTSITPNRKHKTVNLNAVQGKKDANADYTGKMLPCAGMTIMVCEGTVADEMMKADKRFSVFIYDTDELEAYQSALEAQKANDIQ